MEGKYVSAVL